MYERKALTRQQTLNQVRLKLAIPSQKQYMYAELEGNKDDIVDVLLAFGITILLVAIAISIFRG